MAIGHLVNFLDKILFVTKVQPVWTRLLREDPTPSPIRGLLRQPVPWQAALPGCVPARVHIWVRLVNAASGECQPLPS